MNITVDDIKDSVSARLRKDLGTVGLTGVVFNKFLWTAFLRELRVQIGLPETFIPGSSEPAIGLENSQRSLEALNPLLVYAIGENSIKLDNGILDTTDMMVISSMMSYTVVEGPNNIPLIAGRPIDFIPSNQISHKLVDPINPPTEKYPISNFSGPFKVKITPQFERAQVIYYRVPNRPFRDFTIDSLGEIYLPEGEVHDGSVLPVGTPSRTQQIELDFRTYESIENRIYEMVAARNVEQVALQMAGKRKTQGQ